MAVPRSSQPASVPGDESAIGWTRLSAVAALHAARAARSGQPTTSTWSPVAVLAVAAVSLNLILGYGGMVSFGHAAYLGIGAYAVGILGFYGFFNGWLQLLVAIAASAIVALAIGAVSIRTSGIYFIMITLAFTQMLYYLGISVAEFGGDDGMRLKRRSQLGIVDLNDPVQFYYLALVIMLLSVFLVHRLVNSRFGMVLRACKSNEARSRSTQPPLPIRGAFVIAGRRAACRRAAATISTTHAEPDDLGAVGRPMFMVISACDAIGPHWSATCVPPAPRGPARWLDRALAGDPRAAAHRVGDLFPARPRRHVLQARCLTPFCKSEACRKPSVRCGRPTLSTWRWRTARRSPSSARTAPARRR
jgi:branched-subunit amino acid ABC-type transport system permease component